MLTKRIPDIQDVSNLKNDDSQKNVNTGKGLYTDNLSIGYDSDLISDICLKVIPGQIVAVIGPNGSGKSTLLKTITGQIEKRRGVIYINGADRSGQSVKECAKKLSMVMTHSADPELMTCREVVETGRYPYTGLFGKLSAEDKRKVDDAIAFTGIGDIADRQFLKVSDGQRQRVMLARALSQEPDVLVLDEPTSYLDIRYKTEILSAIRLLCDKKGIAVLMSVHEPKVAMEMADTIVAVGNGRVQRVGRAKEVFETGFIRSLYGLTASPSNDLEKKLEDIYLAGMEQDADTVICPGRIMVAGTMSNAGKSAVAAALCRIFTQDGFKTAPFKSQNMANNSSVTKNGLEMGRAQVMQAMCCGISPDVLMNPVLLKPNDDKGSQVIVMGKSVGNMSAAEYFKYKTRLRPVIKEAFDHLKASYDIVVTEGAGSPVEINLNSEDIVNMGLAEMTSSPVILVADIDRGGVFAQIKGTLDLMKADERKRVKGIVINKFRGDFELLKPGIAMIEDMTGCPVLGCIPYFDLSLDDEDSLSERFNKNVRRLVDIAVVRFPHISNFTDLDTFDQIEDVSVRYVSTPEDMEGADIIVLPGSKNTMADNAWMREKGLDAVIKKHADDKVIIGICGGFQMLGRKISDPSGYELKGDTEGLGLLPVDTVITGDKTLREFHGRIESAEGILKGMAGLDVEGYEIHMGESTVFADADHFTSANTGYCKGNVYGTYVHGLFDKKEIASAVISAVAKLKNISIDTDNVCDRKEHKMRQYDELADIVRASLDMNSIYDIVGLLPK